MVNQKYLDKAETLIEALPYIQRFNRKIVVVKYGGSAMLDEELKANVIKDVVLLKLIGFKPIIVHGGGKEISRWVNKVGMEPRFINGLRVTDKDTMEIAEMVLAKVNKELVTLVESLGVQAVGISGKDGGLLQCHKKLSNGEDIGYVGDIEKVNPKVLQDLLEWRDLQYSICLFRSYFRLVMTQTLILIISMQMMQHVRSQKQYMQKNLYSSLILKGYTKTKMIRTH